ncbi:MAG: cupredoxin domain-containing protein [Bacteroidota bacterium]|nr:cupredoxin domain-containing protein [Bacteroidota bacterium]
MKIKTHASAMITGLILLISINSCSKSGTAASQPAPSNGNSKTITISGMAFPASTTVAKGTSVIWHNSDPFSHTVTSDDGTTFNSGNLAANASFTYVANTAGTFAYHCNIHPGMTGSLTVSP